MFDFTFYAPTRIHFGKNKIRMLEGELKRYASRVLFVYGKESIKRNGIYDDVILQLEKTTLPYWELSGIESNPLLSHVREGIRLCKKENIDFILAVGGGSVIDTAKAIAAGSVTETEIWDFYKTHTGPHAALPIGVILTITGSGSEMNGNSVITNQETKEKRSCGSPVLIPLFSILNPEYTFSVNSYYTAAGIIDILSHLLESYLSPIPGAFVQDNIAAALIRSCITSSVIIQNDPRNYIARANLMWTSSLALNGLIGRGKLADWTCHAIEHELSGFYNITHGVGLALLLPHFLRMLLNQDTKAQFLHYAQHVWGITNTNDQSTIHSAIDKTELFIHSFGLPKTLSDLNIDSNRFEEIAEKTIKIRGDVRHYKQLTKEDIIKILKAAL
jgi:alcohol dehydrogenase YqhD (iron-dependent ADH family)